VNTIDTSVELSPGTIDRRQTVVIGILIGSHLPFLMVFFRDLWFSRPHYQFFPLLLVGIACLLWWRWPRPARAAPSSRLQTGLLLSGLAVLAAAVLVYSLTLAAVAAVLTVGGVLCGMAGRDSWRDWLPVWLLLWLLIPPVRWDWDKDLIRWLQSISSRASSGLLDFMGVRHLMEGNVLVLPGHRLLVDKACSGVDSLFVLVAATALFVVATRRPLLWATLLLASSVVWAGMANVVRVVIIALAQSCWNVDLSTGWQHGVVGYASVGLALLMLACTDRLLAFLLGPIDLDARREYESDEQVQLNVVSKAWNWCVGGPRSDVDSAATDKDAQERQTAYRDSAGCPNGVQNRIAEPATSRDSAAEEPQRSSTARPFDTKAQRLIAAGFVFLAILQVLILTSRASKLSVYRNRFGRWDLPARIDDWMRVGLSTEKRNPDEYRGDVSKDWRYRSDSVVCQISVGFPFYLWHELSGCYMAMGWKVANRAVGPSADDSVANPDPYVEVHLTKPAGQHGFLLFSHYDQAGNAVTPPRETTNGPRPKWLLGSVGYRIARNPIWWLLADRRVVAAPVGQTTLQVQAFVSTHQTLSSTEQEAVRSLFFRVQREVRAPVGTKATHDN
jgi:exosortase